MSSYEPENASERAVSGARSPVRRALTWLLLAVIVVLLYRAAPVFVSDRVFQLDDFLEYWSAGRVNLAGENPYDQQLMAALQQGMSRTLPVMMYNPPMALTFATPLSLLPYPVARVLWFLVSIALTALAVAWLWELAGGARSRLFLVWILAFFFAPTLTMLQRGQLSILMLLGLAGFLRYQQMGRLWLAGAFAALTVLKPHWLPLFWLALLLWSIDRRKWQPLLGAAGALAVTTAIPLLFNPGLLAQYGFAAAHEAPLDWYTPTIGGALRAWLGPEKTWLQFASLPLGVLWLAFYWLRNRSAWDWRIHLPAVTIASVITAVYGWPYDQVVLLVALVPAIQLLFASRSRRTAAMLAVAGLVLNVLSIGVRPVLEMGAFWWLAPGWLLWYLLVRKLPHEPAVHDLQPIGGPSRA